MKIYRQRCRLEKDVGTCRYSLIQFFVLNQQPTQSWERSRGIRIIITNRTGKQWRMKLHTNTNWTKHRCRNWSKQNKAQKQGNPNINIIVTDNNKTLLGKNAFRRMRTESSTNTGIAKNKTNLRSQGIRMSAWFCSECASRKKRRQNTGNFHTNANCIKHKYRYWKNQNKPEKSGNPNISMILCRICQSKEEKAEHSKLSHQCELNQAQIQELETSKQTWEVRESEYQRDYVQNVPAQRRGDGRTKEEETAQTAASGKSREEKWAQQRILGANKATERDDV